MVEKGVNQGFFILFFTLTSALII